MAVSPQPEGVDGSHSASSRLEQLPASFHAETLRLQQKCCLVLEIAVTKDELIVEMRAVHHAEKTGDPPVARKVDFLP